MNPDGTPDLNDAAKAVEAATGAVGAIQKLFPGLSKSSLDRAESKITRRLMKDVELIRKRGAEIGLSEETVMEFADDAFRRHGRRERFEKVVSFAADEITHPENAADVDPDWAGDFRDCAETIRNEDLQRLFGKILAGEINSPGSYSKRTLSVLKSMSQEEAEAFKKLCEYSIKINYAPEAEDAPFDPYIVLVEDGPGGSFNEGAVFHSSLGVLDSLGLVDSTLMRSFSVFPSQTVPFRVGADVVVVRNDGEDMVKIDFSHAVFLPIGRELARVCGLGGGNRLRDVLEDKLTSIGLSTIWIDDFQ